MEPKKMTLSVGNFLSETSFFLSSVCVFSGINSYEKLWLNEPMSKDIYIYIIEVYQSARNFPCNAALGGLETQGEQLETHLVGGGRADRGAGGELRRFSHFFRGKMAM